MTAGERLRRWRGERSQDDVARLLGVTQASVCKLERGVHTPKLGLALRIEQVTGGKVKAGSWVQSAAA